MTWAVCVGIFTSIAAICAQTPQRSLGIFLKFDSTPAQASIEAMKDEVARILRPAGFTIHWRALEENQGKEAFSDIAVFQFRGTCKVQPGPSDPGDRNVTLATTTVSDGDVLPFSEVGCDEVAQILPPAPGDRQKTLGRILGRVMVHELYHALLNATKHTTRGIRKSTFAAIDLAWETLRLDDAEARALLQSAK